MAKISIEIEDCPDGKVQTQIIAHEALPEHRDDWTPAQRLASLVRDALLHKSDYVGLDLVGRKYEEISDD